jgi:hypothetical protein
VCSSDLNAGNDQMRKEMESINSVLKLSKRRMNHVTFTLPPPQQWSVTDMQNILGELQNAAVSIDGPQQTVVGIDLSTAVLAGCSDADMSKLIKSILPSLHSAGLLGALTIASNAFTLARAKEVYEWTHHHRTTGTGIATMATEVMRTHTRRPGQLSGTFSHVMTHRLATAGSYVPPAVTPEVAGKSAAMQQAIRQVQDAVEDFRVAMDRCVQAEKVFLSKVRRVQRVLYALSIRPCWYT